MIVYHVQSICEVIRISVKKLTVFIYFPENNLSIESTTHHSISWIFFQVKNIGLMTVMRVHVHHFSYIPYFQGSVVAHCIKLIIFLVELYSSNCVPMPHKTLNLFLVLYIPNSYNSIFTSTYQIFSVWWYRHAANFIKMPLHLLIEFLTFEKWFFTSRLNIPKYQITIFWACYYLFIIWQPFHSCNCFFMTFKEMFFKFRIWWSVLWCNIIKQFIFLLQQFIFQLLPYNIIIIIQNVYLRICISL